MANPTPKKNSQFQEKTRQKPDRRIDLWDKGFPFKDPGFVETSVAKTIWGVLDHCYRAPDMGLIIGASGSGKTRTLQEYKREEFFPVIITCSIATRSLGSILHQLAPQLNCNRYFSNYDTIEGIINRLSESPRLLVFDDCHFLRWEQYELVRAFYDRAGCGIAFIGQETLYDKMVGNRRSYQWDQLVSRVGVHYRLEPPTEDDVEAICQGIYADLDCKCLKYLVDRSRGTGRLRAVAKLLAKAVQVHAKEEIPLDVSLLKNIDGFLTLKGGGFLP
jgi:DNA transposition AAA+ family ATPase